ncbi:hypothetical protein D9M69_403170 [compost metagenome]
MISCRRDVRFDVVGIAPLALVRLVDAPEQHEVCISAPFEMLPCKTQKVLTHCASSLKRMIVAGLKSENHYR